MKKIKVILLSIAILWLLVVIVDFNRVTRDYEKPIFCIVTETADDGGSGQYIGLGYSFVIEGNFMPEDEFPGVTGYEAKILGLFGMAAIRD